MFARANDATAVPVPADSQRRPELSRAGDTLECGPDPESAKRRPGRYGLVARTETRVTVEDRELTLSNLDKVLFPESGFTKGQLIDYYVKVAPVMLPHIADRPLTMKRYPDGVEGKFFYEKHVPKHAPDWVRTVPVPTGEKGEVVEYSLVCDLPTLVWAANLGTIEFHVPLWRVGKRRKLPGPPDFIVFDLDPGEGSTLVQCCQVALAIEELLRAKGLDPKPKTSGSKGLQVYAGSAAGRRGRGHGPMRTTWRRPWRTSTPDWSPRT